MVGHLISMQDVPVWNSWLVKLDSRLRRIHMILYQFTSGLNGRSPMTYNLQPLPFQDLLLWVEYGLHVLPEIEPVDGLSNLLRYALLAFMTTWINSSAVATYDFLANQLRHVLLSTPGNPRVLSLWALFVGAVSVFTIDDQCWLLPMLSQLVKELDLKDWDTVREYLESLPWVRFIHDKRAQEIWKQASAITLQDILITAVPEH